MHSTGPSTELSDSWQLTQFAEAPSLSTFMLSLAILPPEYIRGYAGSKFPIYVWINKLLHPPSIAADFANLTGRIYDEIEQILGSESLQLKEINLIGVNEFNGSQSFGTVFIGMEEWKKSDEMHKVSIIAKSLIRQWIGGLITIASRSEICFQEDLVQYLANKIVYRLFASDHLKIESYRLSEYVKVQMAETFFAPGESLSLSVDASIPQIQSHCALKGVIQLESLESILGEATFLSKITSLISQHKFRTYRIESLLEHLRMHLIDGSINLSQVFEFWRKNGGIPNLFVEKLDEKIRLTQINRNRQSQIGNYLWAPMPLWPLRISIRNLSLPVNFMVSQGLEMAPIDKKILALNNFDFENLYRVNYDQNTWERIHQSMSESPEFFTARSRAQLINDFCYFYSLGEIGDNADKIRRNFLQLIRNEAESFDLCEFYAFWCIAGNKRKISLKKDSRKRIMQFMPKVYSSLSNRENFACFEPPLLGNDTASNTANALCQTVFGSECL
uniref:Peptidase M1 membrane alanine aminopeptidase domain-containing protein n=1 Tax=Panagrolaimus superbus TaxID=310955 RepID=A0A914Z1N4_9BILA